MPVTECRNWYAPRVAAATVLSLAMLTSGCSSEAPQTESAADHEGHTGGRVYFVQPRDGATVTSPVQFEFASEQLTIASVPPGEVKEVRPGMAHYHLGVDTDCLPPGQVIPRADPWIHFGDGKNVIEMQLEPGQHRFAVQAGDDLHRTMEGLCETISVNVTG